MMWIPEGYEENEINISNFYVVIEYGNKEGEKLYYIFRYMQHNGLI